MLKHLTLQRPIAIFDLETTGTDTKSDRIVEISVLTLKPGGEQDLRTRRVNPEMPIPPAATEIHGISDADVANAPNFKRIAKGLVEMLEGCDLCGYNLLRFDLKLLLAEFQRAGVPFSIEGRRLIDPCRIFHEREPRDLSAAVQLYCGRAHEGAHGAEADVLATLAVLEGQLARYEDLPRDVASLDALFRDPGMADVSGFFLRLPNGAIQFQKGKYKASLLAEIVAEDRGYLEWMLGSDFMDDTKQMIRDALQSNS